jgi:hypothetical protein
MNQIPKMLDRVNVAQSSKVLGGDFYGCMNNIYGFLQDNRTGFIGLRHWLGNLRWFAQEGSAPGSFVFKTAPLDATENEHLSSCEEDAAAIRTLLGMEISGAGEIQSCVYRADGMTATFARATLSLLLPLERYGACLTLESKQGAKLAIKTSRSLGRKPAVKKSFTSKAVPGQILWQDGDYNIVSCYQGQIEPTEEGSFTLAPDSEGIASLALAFHPDLSLALKESDMLFSRFTMVAEESRKAWEDYLISCPVAEITQNFTWEAAGETITHTSEEIRRRQYWHWQCLLVNVYDLPFNQLSCYLAPDKSTWFGVWSNDGPESLRALSHTNRHDLARRCIVEYLRTALSPEGDLSWYLHASGEGCLGRAGDSGRLSHGVPLIVATVEEYVRITGDQTLLDVETGPGGTVWEKIKRYMQVVTERRDVNGDGLVEWCNLWEGASDDKVGCFFSSAPIEAWVQAVVNLPDAELKAFYQQHSRPTVNLYEQAFFLHAFQAFERLAVLCGEPTVATEASDKKRHLINMLEERHWNETDGFYYDWDVQEQRQTQSMNQDAFYLLRFLQQPGRISRVLEHLNQAEEFGLRYVPTLAKKSKGFHPDGYWCGGYWPRESSYIGEALLEVGQIDKAYEVVLKALCSGRGKEVLENVNPITGKANTPIVMMAYSALLVLALIKIQKIRSLTKENTELSNL